MSEQDQTGTDPAAATTGCGSDCSDALDRLWEYLDAELAAPDTDRVRAHLAECQGCLREYDVEVVVKKLVRRCTETETPVTLRTRIHEQIMLLQVREASRPLD